MGEVGSCDVAHNADMSRRDLDGTMAVMGAKVAAVPGAAEQRRGLAGFAAEDVEDGRELLREQEKPAIGEPPSPLSSRRSRRICSWRL